MQSYRFSNLLGATYQGGTVQFSPDGNTLLSPLGNRVNTTDLVQGRCATLPPQNRRDIGIVALSPDCRLLLSIDCTGHALLVNYLRGCILHQIGFKGHVQCAKWSPNSNWLAVARDRKLMIWRAPTIQLGWQFVMHKTMTGHLDDIVDLDWSPDSQFITTCSKDMTVRLYSVKVRDDFQQMALADHRSHVRGTFFSADMEYIFSLSREGVFVSLRYEAKSDLTPEQQRKPLYCRPGEWKIAAKANCQQPTHQKVTRCAFDRDSKIFLAGFSEGIFMLYELPEFQTLQTLSLGNQSLDAVALGAKGDWVAVGSSGLGQLLVWEWRSETYVLKQQGHHWGVHCVAFSPAGPPSMRREKTLSTAEAAPEDRSSALGGRLLATGGYDGKIKLFNSQSGLCFVTFAEHTAPVTALCFTPQGNAVLSASQDGSVRAFDLLRYRNFRTFASPDGLCQFASVAVDGAGEIVAASATGGNFAIYVWSIQTGNVLDVLTSHTSYVQSLRFSTSAAHPGQLISASWDSTLKVWDLYANANKGGAAETLQCPSSVLCVAYDPRGNDECAAACLSGQVLFWNVSTGQNTGSIDGLRDILSGRQWHDRFSSSHSKGMKSSSLKDKTKNKTAGINLNQHYNSLAYAKSGELLLCGSRNSPHVCLYDTSSHSIVSRMQLTANSSLSGVHAKLDSRMMTEAGVSWQEFDLSDEDADDPEVTERQKRIRQANSLPGVNVGEAKDAYTDRELHVWGVAFSADMQQFAAATTHGVFVYAADHGLGMPGAMGGAASTDMGRFVPQMLTKNVSAPAVLKALSSGDLSRAMILALALNDYGLLRKVYEKVPVSSISAVVASIGAPLLPALIWFLSLEMRPSTGTPHFQFHIQWVSAIIDLHFLTLTEMSTGKATPRTGAALEAAATSRSDVAALCLQLLMELSQRHTGMGKTFDSNTYLLRYIGVAPQAVDADGEGGLSPVETGTHASKIEQVLQAVAKAEEEQAAETPDSELAPSVVRGTGKKKKAANKKRAMDVAPGTAVPGASAPGTKKKRKREQAGQQV
mmetsp:Transcript_57770/g.161155  ORF Transcript_57770/g.161155 Transcript_57770/m.161155 type:complete len:1040 (-) Transcript_57770:236-3355(-)